MAPEHTDGLAAGLTSAGTCGADEAAGVRVAVRVTPRLRKGHRTQPPPGRPAYAQPLSP